MSSQKASGGAGQAPRSKASPKGVYVNLPDDMKQTILGRCEESMRDPAQEIVWIVRQWLRSQEEVAES